MIESKPKPLTEIDRLILLDKRLSHGAFRLWHLLRAHATVRGVAWLSMRALATLLGSNCGQIALWRKQLIACGYLTVDERRRGQWMRYRLGGTATASGNTSEPIASQV